jgi:hypothetical protein
MYLQFQPAFQFAWPAKTDSIKAINGVGGTDQGLDSAFLCLGLNATATDAGIYGNGDVLTKYEVYKIDQNATFKADSNYRIAADPNITVNLIAANLLGDVTIKPSDLKNFQYYNLKQRKDSVRNQIRIKFNNVGKQWVKNNWLHQDTSTAGFDGFKTASNFLAKNKGFYIRAVSGNSVQKISLVSNANSRFEIWYKFQKNGLPDTANQFFYFNSIFGDWYSANANYIKRTTAGSNVQTSSAAGADNLVYLETTPGSFTKIKMPFLKNFPNKIIHRAELIIQEDPAFINPIAGFSAPNRVFLDCYDSILTPPERFVSVPIDYSISNGQPDYFYFGGDKRIKNFSPSATHATYSFVVTKYFQSMITRNATKFDFRLYAPFDTRNYSQSLGYYYNFGPTFPNTAWPLINTPTFGRVVIGGGGGSSIYKMKLKVIYSNI